MYSVVLATMLTAGGAAPDWHGCGGCHCSCSGCSGNAFSSCRCGGGCYGCWGCSGCYGCRGCSGCWGCTGCSGGACYGCYGAACFGCSGCSGCACYGSGCWGCTGCGGAPGQPAPAPKPVEKKAEAASARITVRLPADAKLSVDGVECPLASDTRAFETPRLQPGQKFYYTVKAEVVRDGKPVSETKRVIFEAGRQIDVEFRLPVESARR